MYRINPLPRKVLITTDEVIAQGPVDNAVSPRNLQDAITIAEERFIKPMMCKEFYYGMRDQKNTMVTALNKTYLETLVNEDNVGDPIELEIGEMVNSIDFVTNATWKEWWYEFGWKITAEAVVYIATPTNWVKYTSSGLMMNNPKSITNEGSGAASGDLKDVKWRMDKTLMDRLDPLIAASHEWLCDNRGGIVLYNCKRCACDEKNSGISTSRKSPWIHIYGNSKKGNCCND